MHIASYYASQDWKWVGWPRQSGSLFEGSSGSHPQTKLSGCVLDFTCSLKNSVRICMVTELWVWWMHWNIIGAKPQLIIPLQAVLKYVCGIQRFHLCPRNLFCILPRMKKSMVYCSISKFFMSCYITFKKKTSTSGSQVDHMWRYFSFCEKLGPCIFPMLRIVGLMAGRQTYTHTYIHTQSS